jgi:peptidoglycan/LPS O-acetylase OafA/YrhL
MIQRIQSIWLLLASAGAFLSLKFSFYDGTYTSNNAYHQLTGTDNVKLLIVTSLVGALALFTVFLFKNRKLQLRMCIAGILLDILLVVLYFIETKDFSQGTYNIAALLPAAVIILFFLAARCISNDEKLVKGSDRLR